MSNENPPDAVLEDPRQLELEDARKLAITDPLALLVALAAISRQKLRCRSLRRSGCTGTSALSMPQ